MSATTAAPAFEQGEAGVRAAVVNPALRRLLSGFACVNLGEWAFVTALSILAYRVAGTLAVGLVGFRFVPGALSSAILAPIVDQRRSVLSRIAAIRALLLGLAAAAVLAGVDLAVVLVIVSIDATVAAPYRPAQSRLLPSLARAPAELSAAAAGISMVKTIAQALGALAGGVAVAFVDPGYAMAAAAGVMVLAAGLTVGLGRPTGRERRVRGALRSGLAAIPAVLGHRDAGPLVLASGLRTLIRGLWTALLVVVALRLFHLGSSGVGVFNAAAGVGALLALPITVALIGRPRLGVPCALAFIGAGLGLTIVGTLGLAVLAVVVIAAWGIAMALADATSLSLLHRLLDASKVGRAVGVMESLKLGTEGLGALLAPALVAIFGLRGSLILAGLPLPLLMTVSLPRLRSADDAAAGRGAVVGLLHGVGVLRSLDMASLEDLAARLRPLQFGPGADVVRQGEPGERFYVIESGEAIVLVDGYEIARLGAGAGFGERALLRDTFRSATVQAATALSVQAIDRADFLSAITGQPVEEIDAGPLQLPWSAGDMLSRPLPEVLAELSLLAGLDRVALERLADGASVERFAAGDVVVREGDPGDAFHVVLSGRAQTTIEGRIVSELLPGDSFGEIAILHRVPRTATVAALEPLTTCRIPAESLLAATAERSV